MKPLYNHDCNACIYLGSYKNYDLYYCGKGSTTTVIARYSDDGPDYISGLCFASSNELIAMAAIRALLKNLITIEELKKNVRN